MGAMIVFLLLAWALGMATSTTFDGGIHLLPAAAAVVLVFLVRRMKRDRQPPPRIVHKAPTKRTTWSV